MLWVVDITVCLDVWTEIVLCLTDDGLIDGKLLKDWSNSN